jgi:hypothetical protein
MRIAAASYAKEPSDDISFQHLCALIGYFLFVIVEAIVRDEKVSRFQG